MDEQKPRQVRIRYTGDGTLGAAGFPANPQEREFWAHMTDDEIERLEATGIYEHAGEYEEPAPNAADEPENEKED